MADQEPEVINGMEASKKRGDYNDQEIDLYTIIHRMIVMIVYPDPGSSASSTSLLQRIKTVLSENLPLLGEGSRNSGKKLLQWTRRGSPFKSSSCYICKSVVFSFFFFFFFPFDLLRLAVLCALCLDLLVRY
ncbi:hypothetical protein OIU78_000598 [Salix suchowensis]|nr:hypothetical protein OIU78_000598 [Salix suchowensis]